MEMSRKDEIYPARQIVIAGGLEGIIEREELSVSKSDCPERNVRHHPRVFAGCGFKCIYLRRHYLGRVGRGVVVVSSGGIEHQESDDTHIHRIRRG